MNQSPAALSSPSDIIFSCEKCQFESEHVADFNDHMITSHCTVSFCCSICSFSVINRRDIEEHYIKNHCLQKAPSTAQQILKRRSSSSTVPEAAVVATKEADETSVVLDLSATPSEASSKRFRTDVNLESALEVSYNTTTSGFCSSPSSSASSSPLSVLPVAIATPSVPAMNGCFLCNTSLSTPDKLRNHVVQAHRWIPCLFCLEIFEIYDQLETHVRSQHQASDSIKYPTDGFSRPTFMPIPLTPLKNVKTPDVQVLPRQSSNNPLPSIASPAVTTNELRKAAVQDDVASLAVSGSAQTTIACRACGKMCGGLNDLFSHISSQHFASNMMPPTLMPPMFPLANTAAAALAKLNADVNAPDLHNNCSSAATNSTLSKISFSPNLFMDAAPPSIFGFPSFASSLTLQQQQQQASNLNKSPPTNQEAGPSSFSLNELANQSGTSTVQEMALQCIAELSRRDHTKSKQPFMCKLCNRNLSSAFSLLCHYRSHAGIKPYSCSVCHARFTQQNSLTYHMLIHKNLKPFMCNVCGRSYRNKQLYKKHMLLHTDPTAAAAMAAVDQPSEDIGLSIPFIGVVTADAESAINDSM